MTLFFVLIQGNKFLHISLLLGGSIRENDAYEILPLSADGNGLRDMFCHNLLPAESRQLTTSPCLLVSAGRRSGTNRSSRVMGHENIRPANLGTIRELQSHRSRRHGYTRTCTSCQALVSLLWRQVDTRVLWRFRQPPPHLSTYPNAVCCRPHLGIAMAMESRQRKRGNSLFRQEQANVRQAGVV
ncbi:unnamed protein product [Protopolystoma xenopodis]|uniref:Uncharacterized protein n=1 Tax=Protopolystoma xenopodis TaxID=117903 RepID=A0A3S5FH44_9PLAT|nr:unnamed protein product [Protopolystoma xenopodis]